MRRHLLLPVSAIILGLAVPAMAQQVKLTMRDGLVTLEAQNVSARQILAEWARVGRVTVVNGEKVSTAPLTLLLPGVPERQALDSILRGVAGFMVSARPDSPAGSSLARYEKVIILASSAAPVTPPAPVTPGPGASPAGARQLAPAYQPQPQITLPDGDDDGFDDDEDAGQAPAPVFPGNLGPRPAPGITSMPQGMPTGMPRQYQVPTTGYPPTLVNPGTAAPGTPSGTSTRPANPFMPTGASGAPGVVAPVLPGPAISPTNPGAGGPPRSSQGTQPPQ